MSERKPMTKAAKKHHIKTAGQDRCPYCKADAYGEDSDTFAYGIEFGDLDPVEDGTIEQKCKCMECKRRWMDIWILKDVHELCD